MNPGSVDREHNVPGSRLIETDPKRVSAERRRMDQPPYSMDRRHREVVLASVVARCLQRKWSLLAAHMRTNHVHLVIEGEARSERIMNDLKSYASQCLNRMGEKPGCKRWARHGGTQWLWNRANVTAAIRYVVDGQGEPMSVFEATASFGRGSVTAF